MKENSNYKYNWTNYDSHSKYM